MYLVTTKDGQHYTTDTPPKKNPNIAMVVPVRDEMEMTTGKDMQQYFLPEE